MGLAHYYAGLERPDQAPYVRLVEKGIRATFINSTLSSGERRRRTQEMVDGQWELVYCAPERFTPRFLHQLRGADIRVRAQHRYALADRRRGVRHGADDARCRAELFFEIADRLARRDRQEGAVGAGEPGVGGGDRIHLLRLDREDDDFRIEVGRILGAHRSQSNTRLVVQPGLRGRTRDTSKLPGETAPPVSCRGTSRD